MQIRYSCLCEDNSQVEFVNSILPQFLTYNSISKYKLEFVPEFNNQYRAVNNKTLDKLFKQAALLGMNQYKLDLLFIGRDVDDFNIASFTSKKKFFENELGKALIKKTVIALPVQAIEHWLLYLKLKKDQPKTTKNPNYEKVPKKEAKQKVYGLSRTTKDERKVAIEHLTADLEFDWLINRSPSFRYTYDQLVSFF